MAQKNDWRLQGQDKYLHGVRLVWKRYSKYRDGWDHDHCEFCSAKFAVNGADEDLSEGYATEDNYHWICKQCFEDFVEMFKWQEIENRGGI